MQWRIFLTAFLLNLITNLTALLSLLFKCVPNTVPRPLGILPHLISGTTLRHGYNYPYFTDEKTKAQALELFKVKRQKWKYLNKDLREKYEYSTQRERTHLSQLPRAVLFHFYRTHRWEQPLSLPFPPGISALFPNPQRNRYSDSLKHFQSRSQTGI